MAKGPRFVLYALMDFIVDQYFPLIDAFRGQAGGARGQHLQISVSQNEAIKRLAAWAATIAVPTMIAGVYGMNFKFMPELEWSWGYPVTMTVMGVVCGFLYYRFKRAGWL